ncbi:AraC family transcriptional regulator [Salipaludibacillus sp. HK11]|uniref:AraC family transcriptional regulator n=1 Tax=Salipaludibacillus sp. HK11 TaxID=3394320 RepID=UPI0039FC392C
MKHLDELSTYKRFPNIRYEVYLHGAHTDRVDKGWISYKHVHHTTFEMNLVFNGCQTARIGSEEYNQCPGDLLIVPPMHMHEYQVIHSDTMQYFVVHVQVNDPDFLQLMDEQNSWFYPKEELLNKQITPLLDEFYYLLQQSTSKLAAFSKFFEMMNILEKFFRDAQEEFIPDPNATLAYEIARSIDKMIHPVDFQENTSNWLELISKEKGISRRHCHRIFQQTYNMSPREYLMVLRQQEAMKMLTNTTDSIEQIAHKIGYENIQSFIRQFAKWTGKTPGAFRKKYKETFKDYGRALKYLT